MLNFQLKETSFWSISTRRQRFEEKVSSSKRSCLPRDQGQPGPEMSVKAMILPKIEQKMLTFKLSNVQQLHYLIVLKIWNIETKRRYSNSFYSIIFLKCSIKDLLLASTTFIKNDFCVFTFLIWDIFTITEIITNSS